MAFNVETFAGHVQQSLVTTWKLERVKMQTARTIRSWTKWEIDENLTIF